MQSKRITRAAGTAVTMFALCGLPAVAQAQSVAGTSQTAQAADQPAGALRSRQVEPDLVNIDFEGGSLAQFVDAMREAMAPGDVNVILRNGAEAIQVPKVTLRHVTPEAALEAICPRAMADVYNVQKDGAPIYVIEGRQHTVPVSQGTGGLVASPSRPSPFPVATPVEPQLRIYSVKELLTDPKLELDGVMDALKMALKVQDEDAQPELMYHEPSGVLIVRGTPGQQEAVSNVLRILQNDTIGARLRAEEKARQMFEEQAGLRRAQAEAEAAMVEMQARQAELVAMQRAVEEGVVSEDELRHVTNQVKRAELVVREMQAELEARRQMLVMMGDDHASTPSHGARVEFTDHFEATHSDVVVKLFAVLSSLARANGQGGVQGVEMKDGEVVVHYAGSEEGVEHFREACKIIRLLDQGG